MSSRKRDREGAPPAAPAEPQKGTAPTAGPNAARSSSPSPSQESDDAASFGGFLWNDVSVVLFYRLMHEIHDACLALAKAPTEARPALLAELTVTLDVVWAVAARHLTEEERTQSAARYATYAAALVQALQGCVAEAGGGASVQLLCRALQRLLEEHGFPEAEFGPLASLSADVSLREDVLGYSYSERPSLTMPVPVRYEGEKRSEEEHSRKRAGFEVALPLPHPHPEVNTLMQLAEPKKRKPALDESRIFSLPKRAATFAADDFVVDDELLHRAYVVLTTHLDAHGSLAGLSPYARLLLWNLLDRNDALFGALYDQRVSSESTRQQLLKLRELLAVHKLAFEETRAAARRTASLLGWYAASAQWRDQALSKLEELEVDDWYLLVDVYRSGGRAVFPNYAHSAAVAHLAIGVLRKLDKIHAKELDGAPPAHTVATKLLLPLLRGEVPELGDYCFSHGAFTPESAHWQRRRRKLRAVMEETAHKPPPAPAASCTMALPHDDVQAFLCASLIFPLQCMAELLEMCGLVLFSASGFDAFTRSFLATNWEDEGAILAYLLRREPTNLALVPLVGIPRVYRDMITAIQLLAADKMVAYVVEARRLASEHAAAAVWHNGYPYWKALGAMFLEEDRFDDLCRLQVSTREDATLLYTTAIFERTPKVWPEDLAELREEEAMYRRSLVA